METSSQNKCEQIKIKQKEFLVLLLDGIEKNGDHISLVAQSLNRSPQNLNYHLKKLIKTQFIEKRQSYPYSIYCLTSLGQRIKKILGQSEKLSSIYRCHNLIVGFDIFDYGTFDFTKVRLCQMNNWYYFKETVTDSLGEWGINIQSSGLLKIYCPERYDENPSFAFAQLYDVASRIAQKYSEMYGMKIGLMRIVREGHKELVDSEKLASLFGRTRIGGVWADASTGTEWLEEEQSSNSIENLLKVPEEVEKLRNLVLGSVNTLNAIANTQLMTAELIRQVVNLIKEQKNGDKK